MACHYESISSADFPHLWDVILILREPKALFVRDNRKYAKIQYLAPGEGTA